MDTREFTQWLAAVLEVERSWDGHGVGMLTDHLGEYVERVQEFDEAGVLSSADGLLVRMENGDEYQIAVVQTSCAIRRTPRPMQETSLRQMK